MTWTKRLTLLCLVGAGACAKLSVRSDVYRGELPAREVAAVRFESVVLAVDQALEVEGAALEELLGDFDRLLQSARAHEAELRAKKRRDTPLGGKGDEGKPKNDEGDEGQELAATEGCGCTTTEGCGDGGGCGCAPAGCGCAPAEGCGCGSGPRDDAEGPADASTQGATRLFAELGGVRDNFAAGLAGYRERAKAIADEIKKLAKEALEAKGGSAERYARARLITVLLNKWNAEAERLDKALDELASMFEQVWSRAADDAKALTEAFDADESRLARLMGATGAFVASNVESAAATWETKAILADPNFPVVVGAPENKWAAKSNRVFNIGWFGNTQFAIVRESLGVYRLKSSTFDPDALIATIPSVTRAGLRAAALMSGGLPVPGADGQDTTTQAATASRAELEGELAQVRELTSKQRLSRISVIEVALRLAQTNPADQRAFDTWRTTIEKEVNEAQAPMKAAVAEAKAAAGGEK